MFYGRNKSRPKLRFARKGAKGLTGTILVCSICVAAPLMAQPLTEPEQDKAIVQPPAQVASSSDANTDTQALEWDQPGEIWLVEGSDRIADTYGHEAAIADTTEICLGNEERAILSSERGVFEISGEKCFLVGEAEAEAYGQGLLLAQPDGIDYSIVIQSQGPSVAQFPAGKRLGMGEDLCLIEEDQVKVLDNSAKTRVLEGPGCFSSGHPPPPSAMAAPPPPSIDGRPAASKRRRSQGIVRRPAGASRPVIFRVASGSASALKRFERGLVVSKSRRICLRNREQITIAGSNGQRVTYRGPGCMQRSSRPTSENLGGFTFG